MMNAQGWKGVHALDAIAVGEGPPTLADGITQEFQWSRSLMVVLLTVLPKYWSQLPWRIRFQFLFSELWYPLFSVAMVCGLGLPILAIATKHPLVQVSYLDFLLHSIPVTVMTLAVPWFLKRQGCLRPYDSPFFTWEMGLFQVIRWPWAAYGSIMGLLMVLRRRNATFRVTPKGAEHPISLPWKVLTPYIAVLALTWLPTLIVKDAGAATGYFFFLILTQVVYSIALLLIVLLHRNEVRKHQEGYPEP